ASSLRRVEGARASSCCRLVALAIGAAVDGGAARQASATRGGFAFHRADTSSKVFRMRRPPSFRYFSPRLPRVGLARSSFVRYLPVRKPEASAKNGMTATFSLTHSGWDAFSKSARSHRL